MADLPGIELDELGSGITRLRLNRPAKLNALADDTVDAILVALDQVGKSSALALIVTGAGRGFCAGFDLSLADMAPDPDIPEQQAWMTRQEKFASLVTKLRQIPQPTIAAVNGVAAGAGLGLALACDLRIGGQSARFSSAFIKVGMSSCDIGVSYLLPRAIGTTRAFDMMLTGRMVEAAEADRIGLISQLVKDEALPETAEKLAQSIAANGKMGTWMTKRGMWANLEAGSLAAAIELENRTQILIRGTGDLERLAAERGFTKKS